MVIKTRCFQGCNSGTFILGEISSHLIELIPTLYGEFIPCIISSEISIFGESWTIEESLFLSLFQTIIIFTTFQILALIPTDECTFHLSSKNLFFVSLFLLFCLFFFFQRMRIIKENHIWSKFREKLTTGCCITLGTCTPQPLYPELREY